MKTHEEWVLGAIVEQTGLGLAQITREKRLREDLRMDSLDCVELVMELEDTFHISISDADAEKLETVGQVIDYINHRMNHEGHEGHKE